MNIRALHKSEHLYLEVPGIEILEKTGFQGKFMIEFPDAAAGRKPYGDLEDDFQKDVSEMIKAITSKGAILETADSYIEFKHAHPEMVDKESGHLTFCVVTDTYTYLITSFDSFMIAYGYDAKMLENHQFEASNGIFFKEPNGTGSFLVRDGDMILVTFFDKHDPVEKYKRIFYQCRYVEQGKVQLGRCVMNDHGEIAYVTNIRVHDIRTFMQELKNTGKTVSPYYRVHH